LKTPYSILKVSIVRMNHSIQFDLVFLYPYSHHGVPWQPVTHSIIQRTIMSERTTSNRLQVATELYRFIQEEALPGTGLDAAAFWSGFDQLVHDLAPKNRELLAERDRLQAKIDDWHRQHPGPIQDMAAYQAFLRQIGYLKDAP